MKQPKIGTKVRLITLAEAKRRSSRYNDSQDVSRLYTCEEAYLDEDEYHLLGKEHTVIDANTLQEYFHVAGYSMALIPISAIAPKDFKLKQRKANDRI